MEQTIILVKLIIINKKGEPLAAHVFFFKKFFL